MSRADDEDAGRSRHRGAAHMSTADDENVGVAGVEEWRK
jgi:hypothetical protein